MSGFAKSTLTARTNSQIRQVQDEYVVEYDTIPCLTFATELILGGEAVHLIQKIEFSPPLVWQAEATDAELVD